MGAFAAGPGPSTRPVAVAAPLLAEVAGVAVDAGVGVPCHWLMVDTGTTVVGKVPRRRQAVWRQALVHVVGARKAVVAVAVGLPTLAPASTVDREEQRPAHRPLPR